MIAPSNEYLEALEQTSISPKSKIKVGEVEYLGNVIKEAPKIKHSSTKAIGTFPTKTVSFTMYNFDNDIDFENKEVEVYKGTVINGNIEYLKQGVFIPQKENITTNISERTISFSDVKDKTQLLDGKYVSNLDWSNNKKHSGLEIVQEICTRRNITLKNTNFNFANYMFKQPNFDEKTTERRVIASIAEIGGEIAIFDYNGNLEIKGKNQIIHNITRKRYEKLSYEKTITFNTVVLGKEGVNDDIIYPETIDTERVEIKILDNPFVDLYREEMIETIANYLIGITYIPFKLENFVDGYMYELNDSIIVTDRNGNEFEANILSIESSTRIKSNISAPKLDNTKTDYTLAGSNRESISKVRLDVNHIDKRVDILAADLSDGLESISKFEQDSENIKASVEKTEKDIKDLSDSIEMFSVDLSQSNLVISVDKNSKPFADAEYSIDFFGYFKGKQIVPNVTINNSQGGVTVSSDNSKIKFNVINSASIANKNFVYEIVFSHTEDGVTYSITKKISLALALQGPQGIQGENGTNGVDGINGTNGADGTSAYFYVRYSKNSNGNPMTTSPAPDTNYMGVATTTSPTAPTSYSAYTWTKIKGENGSQGIRGLPGANGTSSYLHIKWSNDGTTFTSNNGKTPGVWQGTYVDTNPTDSETFGDYTWVDTSIYVKEDLNNLQDSINKTNANVSEVSTDLKNNYLTSEEINALQNHNEESLKQLREAFASLQVASDEVLIEVGSILTDGVNKIKTATGYTFDENGLDISKDGEAMHNSMNNVGMYVRRDNEEVLGADSDGVRAENMTVRHHFIVGKNSRFEDYKSNRTGCFYVGG